MLKLIDGFRCLVVAASFALKRGSSGEMLLEPGRGGFLRGLWVGV